MLVVTKNGETHINICKVFDSESSMAYSWNASPFNPHFYLRILHSLWNDVLPKDRTHALFFYVLLEITTILSRSRHTIHFYLINSVKLLLLKSQLAYTLLKNRRWVWFPTCGLGSQNPLWLGDSFLLAASSHPSVSKSSASWFLPFWLLQSVEHGPCTWTMIYFLGVSVSVTWKPTGTWIIDNNCSGFSHSCGCDGSFSAGSPRPHSCSCV